MGKLRGRVKPVVLAALFAALATLPAPAAQKVPIRVDVKLVIATDVSHSIDLEEAQIQRQGIADGFLDPDVVKAIENGPLGVVAVALVDWSGYRNFNLMLDWTLVKDQKSAAALAEKIRALPVALGERTSISNAIQRSIDFIKASEPEISGTRNVIDLSGDGPNNDGVSLEQVHEATRNSGVIVNGLPIMDETSDGYFPDLDRYYAACVVAGKGSFQIVVKSFKDFSSAMRRKLVFEVSDARPKSSPLLQLIAAPFVVPSQLQRAPAEYPGGCDKFGGWKVSPDQLGGTH